jgi:hypothetical protein
MIHLILLYHSDPKNHLYHLDPEDPFAPPRSTWPRRPCSTISTQPDDPEVPLPDVPDDPDLPTDIVVCIFELLFEPSKYVTKTELPWPPLTRAVYNLNDILCVAVNT